MFNIKNPSLFSYIFYFNIFIKALSRVVIFDHKSFNNTQKEILIKNLLS